ncbi:MAG TPA: hypothetical protein VGY52_00610 [Roseiarcus sp.]|nr:hypothetical protein [Roseiarcus sp.]
MLPIVFIAAVMTSLPNLDMDRVCGGGPAEKAKEEYKNCMNSEQTAKNKLQQNWAQYPAKIRNECSHVMEVAPQASYVELQTCIESQAINDHTTAAPNK